jgi:hypothetical protein
MPQGKNRRVATAVGFLSGVLTCLDALRDARVLWPPESLWGALSRPHRMELAAGLALMLVSFVAAIVSATNRMG